MKKILLLIYMMFPVLVMAQGHKGEVDECAPMKNGKVCYSDDVEIENTSKLEIFNAINAWAKKSYGKDVFLSNVNSNKNKGTIFVSSKVELLLNDTDKTIIKYKMRITCFDNRYTIEASADRKRAGCICLCIWFERFCTVWFLHSGNGYGRKSTY